MELAVAYVSIVPSTKGFDAGVRKALAGVDGSKAIDLRPRVNTNVFASSGARASQTFTAAFHRDAVAQGERVGTAIGTVVGKGMASSIKLALAGVAGAGALATGGIMYSLTKGFDRLKTLDSAKHKLQALGKSADQVKDIIATVTDTVTGTPFALDQAMATATQAIGGNVKDLKRFMTDVADAAGFAGTDIERMGLIFNQIQAKGKLTGEEMMQLMEAGLPAKSWIAESYKLTSDQFDDMQAKGEITMEMLQTSIEQHAGGMAKAAGDSLQGAIDKMHTAIARVGANFLTAIFGGPEGDTQTLQDGIGRVTDKLNVLGQWVNDHKDQIHQYFMDAVNAAKDLGERIKDIGGWLSEHKDLVKTVGEMFLAWNALKFTGLLSALDGVSGRLGRRGGGGILGQLGEAALLFGALNQINSTPGPNTGPNFTSQGAYAAGGAAVGWQVGGPVGAVAGGTIGAAAAPAIDLFKPGQPAQNGVIPPALGGARGSTPTIAGIPMPGLMGRGDQGPAAPASAPRQDVTAGSPATPPPDEGQIRQWVQQKFGIPNSLGTGSWENATHNYDGGWHHTGQGGAQVPSGYGFDFHGTPEQMAALANWIATNAAGETLELIYSGPGFDPSRLIKNGRFGDVYGQGTLSEHTDHVHWAVAPRTYDTGGWLRNGFTAVQNKTGKPELVLNPDQTKKLGSALGGAGIDPGSIAPHMSGLAGGLAAVKGGDGATAPTDITPALRTEGYIPAAAGNISISGNSVVSGFIHAGGEAINGIIDQAASAASSAIAMGAAGAGAPGAGTGAQMALQIGASIAKRGVTYGADMLGIGADALLEQLTPFGAPRWLTQDYSGFMPRMDVSPAAVSSLEQMQQATQAQDHGVNAGAPPGPVSQFDAMNQAVTQASQMADQLQARPQPPMFHVDNITTADAEGVGRELSKTGRLWMMQHAGRP